MTKKTKYQILATVLQTDIEQRTLLEGTRLPTEVELSEKYAVSRQTVRQALTLLENQGLLTRKQGSGTYVSRSVPRRISGDKNVGVICTYITEYIFPSIIRGIEEVLGDEGFALSLSSTNNRTDNERAKLQYYLHSGVSGLIVEGTKTAFPNPNIFLYRELAAKNIPIVFIHAYYNDIESPTFVVVNDRAGGRMATNYLIERGHREIAGIFKGDDRQGVERYAGYTAAFTENNIPFRDDMVLWYTDSGQQALPKNEEILRLTESCTAIVCYNDLMAVNVIKIIEAAGKRVPDDVSIISFDDSIYSNITSVPLTSLAHPKDELGRLAAKKILNLINGRQEASETLGWELVERGSVSRVK